MHLARPGVAVDPRLARQRTVEMVPTKMVEMPLPVVGMVAMGGMDGSLLEIAGIRLAVAVVAGNVVAAARRMVALELMAV